MTAHAISPADRTLVEQIDQEEADAFGVTLSEVVAMGMKPRAIDTRRSAWDRLREMTGWSTYRLAKIWGCDPQSIEQRRRRVPVIPTYDAATVARLHWQHGPDRAASIIRGDDHLTTADIAAWNNLGGKA